MMLKSLLVSILAVGLVACKQSYYEYTISYGADPSNLNKTLVTYCDAVIKNCSPNPVESIDEYVCLVDGNLYYKEQTDGPLRPLGLYCKSNDPVLSSM